MSYNTDSDIVSQLYFKEINKYELLTEEQEIELNKRIKMGDKEAYDEFTQANLRLVIKLARKYSSRNQSLEKDLRQVGNDAMLVAVSKYDPERGKFSTYAIDCIRGGILKYLNEKAHSIKLSQNSKTTVNRIIKISKECGILDMHHFKSMKKITDELNKRYTKKDGVKYTIQDTEMAVKHYGLLLPICLDSPSGDDEENSLISYLEDEDALNPQTEKGKDMLSSVVMEVIENMENEIERDIIIRLYGLRGRMSEQYEEIGQSYGLTGEKIKQITTRVFRRLRKDFEFLYEEIGAY